jgi:acyl carrier protein
MTQEEIQSQVNAFMIDRLGYELSMLTPEAELKRDLGMTSLDAVETAIFIKYSFGFLPERNAIKTLVTLQDLYDYIAKKQVEDDK